MAVPFLSNLGISAIDQARPPTARGFPPAFNQNNASLWVQAVQELEPGKHAESDWGRTIRRYVDFCEARGTYPFQSVHESRNDAISDYLRNRRRAFVKFVNNSNFFESIKLRTTERKVSVTEHGFILTIEGHAWIEDPSFEKWLTMRPSPSFDLVAHEGRHTKTLMDGLTMFAYTDHGSKSPVRWRIGYEISCPMFPDLPDKHLPSKAEIEDFILKVLWLPILRGARPSGLVHRLI
jgi:hypothetical protein